MQRVLRALLMLGLLPGLLVPGGLALRLCLCRGLFRTDGQQSQSCCAKPERRCACSAGAGAAHKTAKQQAPCRCILISAPEQPPFQVPSGGGPGDSGLIALPPPPPASGIRSLALRSESRDVADLLPEPPGKRRNLPLLI